MLAILLSVKIHKVEMKVAILWEGEGKTEGFWMIAIFLKRRQINTGRKCSPHRVHTPSVTQIETQHTSSKTTLPPPPNTQGLQLRWYHAALLSPKKFLPKIIITAVSSLPPPSRTSRAAPISAHHHLQAIELDSCTGSHRTLSVSGSRPRWPRPRPR